MIFDFYEMLGRGIIATRTNHLEEAPQYLDFATRMEPDNPHV